MWTLEQLQGVAETQTYINGRWVPARPENYKKTSMPLLRRLKHAWMVFVGRAEAFTWPEGQ